MPEQCYIRQQQKETKIRQVLKSAAYIPRIPAIKNVRGCPRNYFLPELGELSFCRYHQSRCSGEHIQVMELEEEGICGKVVLVRVEFMVADKLTTGLILELDNDVQVRNQVLSGWWWWCWYQFWASMFMVSHCCHFFLFLHVSFVSSTAVTAPSFEMVVEMGTSSK